MKLDEIKAELDKRGFLLTRGAKRIIAPTGYIDWYEIKWLVDNLDRAVELLEKLIGAPGEARRKELYPPIAIDARGFLRELEGK